MFLTFSAPPDITVDNPWVHASEGSEIELVCTLYGDINSDVS